MNRGPAKGGRQVDFVAKAHLCWAPAPDWVLRVAEECNRIGQPAVAKRLKYSVGVVSQIVSATYKGDLDRVEGMVRGALMAATVDCPARGELSRSACLSWQDKPYAPTSSDRARMYHACRSGCPYSKHTKPETIEGDLDA